MTVELLEAVAVVGAVFGAFAGGGVVGASVALRRMIRHEVRAAMGEALAPVETEVHELRAQVRELRESHA